MLSEKWIAFIVSFWVLGSLICGIAEGAWLGPGQSSVIGKLMSCQLFTADTVTGKIAGAFSGSLWSGMLDMVTWNYAIFSGPWEIVRWVVLMPISIAVIYSVVLQTAKLIRGGG